MRLLIASSVDGEALEKLQRDHEIVDARGCAPERLAEMGTGCDAIIFRSGVQITADVMRRSNRLRLLIRAGSGCDNVDLDYVHRQAIEFVRIPEPGARAVAELAFALMLSLARQIPQADALLRKGRWAKSELEGFLLRDKVLGIIGCGNIGACVGEMGAAWGMEVQGCVDEPSPAVANRLAQRGIRLANFDKVLEEADFLSIHVPLLESTRNLLDSAALRRMKRGAFLVNLARGGVVDERALLEVLQSGHLRGAGLDVHEREGEGAISGLASLPQVLLTPHIGASTRDTQKEIGRRIVQIIRARSEEPRLDDAVAAPAK
ncbi:NAD(P)-dependent oxidoreductase [Candidatus Laterigemmans baculatus]|uniref:NAD(P)-dependent oxidoreductase n=1 Tax=Candidatus Laterigemmans baculatus TaxID=2770505 RepID=UPI0013DA093D|nr:NAD(P)-dependent oxidoreductase [Candidatus Laterigemmans baculatus]